MEALRAKEGYRQIVGFTFTNKRIFRMADYHAALQIHLSIRSHILILYVARLHIHNARAQILRRGCVGIMPATRLRVARSPVTLPPAPPCSFSTHCRIHLLFTLRVQACHKVWQGQIRWQRRPVNARCRKNHKTSKAFHFVIMFYAPQSSAALHRCLQTRHRYRDPNTPGLPLQPAYLPH